MRITDFSKAQIGARFWTITWDLKGGAVVSRLISFDKKKGELVFKRDNSYNPDITLELKVLIDPETLTQDSYPGCERIYTTSDSAIKALKSLKDSKKKDELYEKFVEEWGRSPHITEMEEIWRELGLKFKPHDPNKDWDSAPESPEKEHLRGLIEQAGYDFTDRG